MLLYKVFYTNWSIPDKWSGIVRGPFIFIRPEFKGNVAFLEHEKQHVRQWWRGLLALHTIRYKLSKSYRYQCELEGYAVQYKINGYGLDKYAWYLANTYGLDVTQEQAKVDLLSKVG